ncbi:primase-like DNA-binding domain-containing protein, partial [bacterium]|nr:primase-like DNA-binding domain-containing protein [bacterium]
AQFLKDENWASDGIERTAKTDFFHAYTDYCHESGFQPLGKKNFAARLKSEHRIGETKSGSVRYWLIRQQENDSEI